jgi:RNA polymerase sigma-70 factor (ECF subfamily)
MPPEATDLAAKVRARDPEAIQSVVHVYLAQILRAARGAGLNSVEAEDVTQAVFVTFLEKASDFEGRSQVRTWLFGILYRKIAEVRRQLKRSSEQDDIDAVIEARFNPAGSWVRPPRMPDGHLYDREIRAGLADCLATVPEKQRAAFLLREVDGFSTAEICKVLNLTVTHVGVLLFRARNRLRDCLEAKGIEGSGRR